MSGNSDSSSACSMIPWAILGSWFPVLEWVWALIENRTLLSPLEPWEFSLGSDSGWTMMSSWLAGNLKISFGFLSGSRAESPCGTEVQKLKTEHRLPQFCSHCAWTLCVIASLTSSPQVSRMFTKSTYGLRGKTKEQKVVREGQQVIHQHISKWSFYLNLWCVTHKSDFNTSAKDPEDTHT